MNITFPKSIRANLIFLALLGALPIIAVVLVSGLQLRDQEIRAAQVDAMRLVQVFADRQESIVVGVRQLLVTLASANEVQRLDVKASTKLFQKLVQDNPSNSNFSLVLPNGDVIASARPFTKANFAHQKHFIDTKRTHDFAAGEYLQGLISKEPIIAFSYPVKRPSGELIAIITASIRLNRYEELFKSAKLQENSVISISDHNGIRIFIYPSRSKHGIGEALPPVVIPKMFGPTEAGLFYHHAQDGIQRYYAFQQLRLTPQSPPYLVIAVGIPEAQVLAKADQLTRSYLLWLAIAAFLSLFLAGLIGEYGIAMRIEKFAEVANRVGEGDFAAMAGIAEGKDSFGIVAKAFNNMTVALKARETERDVSNAALQKALAETHTVFEAMGHPVMVLNTNFEIIDANAATLKALGIKEENILGRKCHELFHCTDKPPNGCPTQDLLNRITSGPVQMEMQTLNGVFLVYCTPILNDHGDVERIIHVSTDITEIKATQSSLLAAKEAAEVASKAKSAFLANMSHEIRTPLNGLLGMLHLIREHSNSSEVECYVEMAARSGRRLTSLLGDILDLSRIEAGRMPIKHKPFALANIFIALSETFSPMHMSKQLSFSISADQNVPTDLLGDEVRVRQILFNLIGNAMKFTDQGEVRLEVSTLLPHPSGEVRLLFVVSDTGPGIPEQKINIICSPFTQVSEDLNRSHQGAGLGLSIAQHLVSAIGGTLTFDSTVGQGTSVYLTLPFGVPEHTRTLPPSQERPPDDANLPLKILLVEDDEISRISAKLALEKMGHQVATADNGEKALEMLQRSRYDCVLMDIQMDTMDGIEATKRIRSGNSAVLDEQIPIIAMTAYAMAGDRERFLEAGMDDYVAKPINISEMKRTLAKISGNLSSHELASNVP